jgi:hypothetical protein
MNRFDINNTDNDGGLLIPKQLLDCMVKQTQGFPLNTVETNYIESLDDDSITEWFCQRKLGEPYYFNHIESGHSDYLSPKPKSDEQKVWDNYRWLKRHSRMINGVVK